jgi:hypothetical protein
MLRTLKPFAGPAIALLVGVGVSMGPVQSQWWSGFCIGLALFWGAATLLNNRALLRRFPALPEWLPFLDSTGGFATAAQLTGSFIRGQQFRIAILEHNKEIYDRTFEDCIIYGPAVLAFAEYADAKDCIYVTVSPASKLWWTIDFERDKTPIAEMPAGVIVARKCIFKRCTFIDVGFVGNAEWVAEMHKQFQSPQV